MPGNGVEEICAGHENSCFWIIRLQKLLSSIYRVTKTFHNIILPVQGIKNSLTTRDK